ncbi:hypothetical protein [Pseudooceanicola nanhaiensis]|uniref:hypothetical protein n=1 Tax=Pseudooceanicola nanhaiensis TaxID=375761 RepID=UPI0040593303
MSLRSPPGLRVLLLLLGGAAAPALAERGPHEDGVAPEVQRAAETPKPRPAAWALDPPVLYLAPRETGAFLEERRALMARLGAVTPGGTDHARALTDLAEFHLAHGMAAEGLSLLAALGDETMPPVHRLRAAAFELALGLIDPRDRPLTERAMALLGPEHEGWADQPLFLAMHHVRMGRLKGAGPLLQAAVDRLARFPGPVQERVLPGFLESAIATGQWRLARDLAAAFAAFPELKGSPAYHFLLGQAAEAGDDPLAAFDSYTRAMQGRDRWAHRARRALVDLGLAHAALSPAEAVELLRVEKELWRGDESAAQVLHDLASLQMVEGDSLGAIETYGMILATRPGTAQAAEARQKSRALISRLYAAGAAGELSLSAFMQAHQRIARLYRFDLTFAEAAESFADTFMKVGGTTVAAQEYGTIRDYLAVAEDLGLGTLDADRLPGLAVKQAGALLAGGQFGPLAELLEQGIDTGTPELVERWNLISARYYSETGQTAQVLEGAPADSSPQRLAIKARALFDRADWAGAAAAYEALWALEGERLAFADAINFLLAAFRSGDMTRTAALAEEFPKLTDLPGWAEIAAGLTEAAPELLPLRADTARARIDRAGARLDGLPDVAGTN